MLIIRYKKQSKELEYVLEILLKEFLGLSYQFKETTSDFITIHKTDCTSILSLNSDFFNKKESEGWLQPQSIARSPLQQWHWKESDLKVKLIEPSIPILYGQSGLNKKASNNWHLNLDLFGSAFFMLSRYEELVIKTRDNHNRFPATASLAYKEGFLNRPIVDEYVEILWACLSSLWPELKRKKHIAKTFISCDVDQPFDCTVESLKSLIYISSSDLLKRKSPLLALQRINRYIFNKFGNYKFDPYYTFDWYMDICDKYGHKATFFFIPDSSEKNNACYKIDDPKIVRLIKKIVTRGHKIGVHGSYNTYNDIEKLITQKHLLESLLKKEKVPTKIEGNRQHYLRWDSAYTPEYLDSAGFNYDSTGAYSDYPGFRFGTSHEFSMWGWQKRVTLNLKQKPLIVMECTIIDKYFLGLKEKPAKDLINKLRKHSILFDGHFNLLWHNSYLMKQKDKKLFKYILKKEC